MRNRKHILAIAIMLVIALALSACGQKAASVEDKIVGKYECEAFKSLFVTQMQALGDKIDPITDVKFEFKKGGEIDVLLNGKPFMEFLNEQKEKLGIKEEFPDAVKKIGSMFKYKIEGDKFFFIMGDQKQEAKYKFEGDKLVLEADGQKLEFVRAK